MVVQQLNPPLPVVTPKGKALAHVLIDYGPEHDILWVCFHRTGEIWSYRNAEVRADENITYARILSNQNTVKDVLRERLERISTSPDDNPDHLRWLAKDVLRSVKETSDG